MKGIKATLNFQMNYGVLKTTTTPQILYGKVLRKHQTYNPNTKKVFLVFEQKPGNSQDIKDATY